MRLIAACAVCLAVALCSCEGQGSLLPKSGGRPYEVLLVADGDGAAGRLLEKGLSKDVPGLPQREPMFDVSLTDSARFGQNLRLARNIVVVDIDANLFTAVRVRYEKNVWAKPQMVVYVNAPSLADVRRALPAVVRQVSGLLTRAEMNAEIAKLNSAHNDEASARVGGMFGYGVKIPADMKSSKQGKHFVWFSNNAASGMKNVCVYSYPGMNLDAGRVLAARDSVMRANIPGERQGMYMQTAWRTVESGVVKENGRTMMVCRGLWEMHGDAMGGPFVSHSVVDTANRRVVVAEAFIYAPDMKKRNLMRQVEAALYTLKKLEK